MSSMRGLTAKGVPPQPNWLIFMKGAIILLSLIILGLAAYAISLTGGIGGYTYYGSGAPGFMIFIVVKTLIIFGGMLALERFAPHMFYRLVGVIAYALSIVFWLSGWAWCASWAAAYLSVADYYGFDVLGYDNWAKKEGGALAGCAALGAVVWVLCIVHLAFFVQACIKNPDPSGVAAPGVGPYAANGGNAELGNMGQKPEASLSQQGYPPQAYGQPQPGYPQQPYPQ